MIGTAVPRLARTVQAFVDARGETFRAVVLHALRRHLKYPPPPPAEPLPDGPTSGTAMSRRTRNGDY